MTGYSTKEAARIVGASLRELQVWSEVGILRPERICGAGGTGKVRAFSGTELVLAGVAREIKRKRAVPRHEDLKRIIERLRKEMSNGARYLLLGRTSMLLVKTADEVIECGAAASGPIHVLDLLTIWREHAARVRRASAA